MAVLVPPPPYKTPFVDSTGRVQPMWTAWLREVFQRIGGATALSNVELADLIDVDLTDLQSDVAGLLTDVSTLESNVTSLLVSVNDLGQGRQL